jgi:hypothetical protein
MQKSKHLTNFSLIYGISSIVILTLLLLAFTADAVSEAAIFIRRLFISIFFMLLGGAFIKFKEQLAKFIYLKKDITTFIDEDGEQLAIFEIKYFGTCILIVGAALLVFACIFYFGA